MRWQWRRQDPAYANFGNANQWTVNAGMTALARESAQNSNDARIADAADLVFTLIRLTGERRAAFEDAIGWHETLRPHLLAMGESAGGSVSAGQLRAGVESLDAAKSLVLLRIADYGCRGLTGPEFTGGEQDEFGNFVKLLRLDLFSGKDQAAGGSFGLGKAVYWRFSRLQTALFGSTVEPGLGVDGQFRNRLFGVQQGVVHRNDGVSYDGRGYFGAAEGKDPVASTWDDDNAAESLHLRRSDDRPGTSALIVGFYDPDSPQSGLDGRKDLTTLAAGLRTGVEENFWPILARGRMRVRIDIEEDGTLTSSENVDGEATFTELVHALRKYDTGDISEALGEEGAVVVRDVSIQVPARREPGAHPAFVHHAKLVATLSDDVPDSLENKVCLFRKPEMIVETVDHVFEGRTYHAFLLAGAAIDPAHPTEEQLRADDFLRYSEPPAHDRWIPGTGRRQTSQANLTARYVAPWLPNLKGIGDSVRGALYDLFGTPPPPADTAPSSVLRHLRFLRSEPGTGGRGTATVRKPVVKLIAGRVEDGRWVVDFQVTGQNRAQGWSFEPGLAFVGLDGGHAVVPWDGPLEVLSIDGEVEANTVVLRHKPGARIVKVLLRGRSVAELPIPAAESAVDVVLRSLAPAPGAEVDQ
jgi:hypothetical protein